MKTLTKKNVLLLGSAAMLALAIAGTAGAVVASAADLSSTGSSETTLEITYSQADEWTVKIPASITVNGEEAAEVTAEGVTIQDGKKLQVSVKSQNEYQLKKGAEESGIAYEFKYDETKENVKESENTASGAGETVILEGEGTVYVGAYVEASTGGEEYKDTLTFKAEVVDAN